MKEGRREVKNAWPEMKNGPEEYGGNTGYSIMTTLLIVTPSLKY